MWHMAAPGVTRARSASVFSLVLAVLAVAPVVAGSTLPAAAAPVRSAPAVMLTPAELQALKDKMAQLQVTSERYTTRIEGSFTSAKVTVTGKGTCPAKSRCHPIQRRRVSHARSRLVDVARTAEVDLLAGVGETFDGRGRPQLIVAGANLYLYAPERKGRGRARPWLHQSLKGADAASALAFVLPFSGQGLQETNLGGTGPYARLINLLSTATGAVTSAGPLIVDGQQTSELTATVLPSRLVAGLPPTELTKIEKAIPPEQLQVFVNASGLPLRVVVSSRTGASSLTQTTDLLAVNTPVTVKAPSVKRTRPFPHDGPGAISTGT